MCIGLRKAGVACSEGVERYFDAFTLQSLVDPRHLVAGGRQLAW